MNNQIKTVGNIALTIKEDGLEDKVILFPNRVLKVGRIALANSIANNFGGSYDYWIGTMIFGSNGTSGGVPRYVEDNRNGLFGATIASKGVISSLDVDLPTKVIFTSVLTYSESVGSTLNEMALVMRNGNLFSMATFGDVVKTSTMQLTFNWAINYV